MVFHTPAETRDEQLLLTAILCTRNGAATIGEQLDALAEQDAKFPWELIVVDNGSTDGTPDVVEGRWRSSIPLRIVLAHDHANLSYARNVGVDAAVSDSIAFCDDDDIVGQGWIRAIETALRTNPLVACHMEYDLLNAPALMVGRARFQSAGVETLFDLPVCSGPCGVQKGLWNELGGNDPTLSGTGEDFDFAMRVFAQRGVKPFFADEAIYHYRLRDQPKAIFRQARAYGRSHAQLWARHGTSRIAPTSDLQRAAQDWWWLLTRAPFAAAGQNRSTWLSKLGRRIGRIEMSFRERVLVL